MSCSQPASTGAMILAARIVSTSIMGWLIGGSAWLASTCRRLYRPEGSRIPRWQECNYSIADVFLRLMHIEVRIQLT